MSQGDAPFGMLKLLGLVALVPVSHRVQLLRRMFSDKLPVSFETKGSVIDGVFTHADADSTSDCPDTVWYWPKGVPTPTPTTTSSAPTAVGSPLKYHNFRSNSSLCRRPRKTRERSKCSPLQVRMSDAFSPRELGPSRPAQLSGPLRGAWQGLSSLLPRKAFVLWRRPTALCPVPQTSPLLPTLGT